MFPNNQNLKQKDQEDDEHVDNNIGSSSSVFQIPYDPHQQLQDMLLDDLFVGQTVQQLLHQPNNPNLIDNQVIMSKDQQYNYHETLISPDRSKLSNINTNEPNTSCDNRERKVIRRDNERQRRQHMAILHSSLRSHLPLQLIKEKRSLSDHITAATEYVKQMNTKIEELQLKRNELKSASLSNWPIREENDDLMSPKLGTESSCCNSSSSSGFNYSLTILQPCLGGGVEIVISSSSNLVPLSRVLRLLLQQGIDVASCTTTIVNGRFIHTIQSDQVEDYSSVDMSELQQKLNVMFSCE